ncbi:hypothetical protein A6D98_19325 [Aliivibrio fischeri]|uniref:hypothetical protein n=1 Tax=Aliivibrio fischeri TaxID=668 RepID=UPI00080E229F|nr:hypothetical protein [Aliivibrio fischeri]OCH57553.1 hypothetical protein A6D98_19325 [Aliivibrio fischeri]
MNTSAKVFAVEGAIELFIEIREETKRENDLAIQSGMEPKRAVDDLNQLINLLAEVRNDVMWSCIE